MSLSLKSIVKALLVPTILFTALVAAQNASAATYYVQKTGKDSNTCTQAKSISTPKLTVKAGLSCLASGDTLEIGAGTYAEGIVSTNANLIPNGTSGAYTRIVGNGGVRGSVFLAPTTAQTGAIVLYGRASYIEFNGIGGEGTNWNSVDPPGCCGLSLGGEADASSIHHIRVMNGEFKNNKCGSFGLNKGSDIEIIGNYFHGDECNAWSHGIYVGDNLLRVTIDGNTVEGFMDYGMQFYSTKCPCVSDSIIRNNIFRNNGSAMFGGSGISIGGSNNVAYNNLVYGNHESGIRIQYAGANNIQVYNNTLYNNGDYGIYNVTGTASVVKNNVVWGNKAGTIISLSGDTVANNLTTNPYFVNAQANDFHLSAGSPAIDAGVPITTLKDAFDGGARPQGCCYDAGAYEYKSPSSPPAPPANLRVVP